MQFIINFTVSILTYDRLFRREVTLFKVCWNKSKVMIFGQGHNFKYLALILLAQEI